MFPISTKEFIFHVFNLIQWVIWFWAAKQLFPTRLRHGISWLIEVVVSMAAFYLCAYVYPESVVLRSLSFFLFFGVPIILLYRGKILRKILFIILIAGTMVLTEMLLSLVAPTQILQVARRDFSSLGLLPFYVEYLLCQGILVLAVIFLLRRFEKGAERYISRRDLFLFLLFPVNQYILLTGWYLNFVDDLSPRQLIVTLIVLVFSIVTDIILFRMVLRISDNAKLKAEKELLTQQIAVKNQYYQALAENYRDMSRMRHDIANHVYTVRVLLEDGKRDEALRYTADLQQDDSIRAVLSDCQNSVLRSFLQHRMNTLAESDVPFTADVTLPAQSGISDIDLIIAFGNLLDNASESVKQVSAPYINLKAALVNHCLHVECVNPCPSGIVKKERRIPYLERGIGSAILEELARKYDGSYRLIIEQHICCTTLILKERLS